MSLFATEDPTFSLEYDGDSSCEYEKEYQIILNEAILRDAILLNKNKNFKNRVVLHECPDLTINYLHLFD